MKIYYPEKYPQILDVRDKIPNRLKLEKLMFQNAFGERIAKLLQKKC